MHFELHRLELKGFKCSFRFLFWKVLGKRQIQESRDSSKSPGQKVNTQKNPSSSDLLWLAKKLFQRRRRRRTSQCFSAPQHGLVTGWAGIAALLGVTALSQHAVGLVLCFRILFWNQGPLIRANGSWRACCSQELLDGQVRKFSAWATQTAWVQRKVRAFTFSALTAEQKWWVYGLNCIMH